MNMACRTILLQLSNYIHKKIQTLRLIKFLYFPQNHILRISKISFHRINVTTDTPISSIINESLFRQFW